MHTWEYKTVKVETKGMMGGNLDVTAFDVLLNSLGSEGWEMVAALDTNSTYGQSREVIAIFKRQRTR